MKKIIATLAVALLIASSTPVFGADKKADKDTKIAQIETQIKILGNRQQLIKFKAEAQIELLQEDVESLRTVLIELKKDDKKSGKGKK